MSEREQGIVSKIIQALPRMSDFDKGYLLGKVETLTDEDIKEEKGDEKDAAENVGMKG